MDAFRPPSYNQLTARRWQIPIKMLINSAGVHFHKLYIHLWLLVNDPGIPTLPGIAESFTKLWIIFTLNVHSKRSSSPLSLSLSLSLSLLRRISCFTFHVSYTGNWERVIASEVDRFYWISLRCRCTQKHDGHRGTSDFWTKRREIPSLPRRTDRVHHSLCPYR